jgi:Protein of unknown function (DUF3575).
MKKVLFVALTVVMFSVSSVLAQDNPKNVFKINLGSLAVSTFNFQFEHAVAEKQSLQLGFFYTGFKVSDTKFSGLGITPEYRFYMSQKGAPKGFFMAPFLRYQNFKLTNSTTDFTTGETIDEKAKLSTFGGGAILGFQGLIGNVVSIEVFAGPSYNAGSVKVETEGGSSSDFSLGSFSGFGVRAGFTVGVAF